LETAILNSDNSGKPMSPDIQPVDNAAVEKLESSLNAKIETYFASALDCDPDVLSELLKSKNSEGTRRAYRRDITDFFTRMTALRPNRDSILEFLHLSGHKATLVVTKYRAILNEAGLSPNTINRRLAAIKSLVAYGRKLGVCNYAVDVDNIPVQAYRDTSGCTGEEFLTVIKGCDRSTVVGKRDYACCCCCGVMLCGAMRLARLTWGILTLRGHYIFWGRGNRRGSKSISRPAQ
jgi:integrase/recombinase XerC